MIPFDFSEVFEQELSPQVTQALATLHNNTGASVADLVTMYHGFRNFAALTREIMLAAGYDPNSGPVAWGVLHEMTDATPEKSQYRTLVRSLVVARNQPAAELVQFLAAHTRPRPAAPEPEELDEEHQRQAAEELREKEQQIADEREARFYGKD